LQTVRESGNSQPGISNRASLQPFGQNQGSDWASLQPFGQNQEAYYFTPLPPIDISNQPGRESLLVKNDEWWKANQ
jgi:hypothetical protein